MLAAAEDFFKVNVYFRLNDFPPGPACAVRPTPRSQVAAFRARFADAVERSETRSRCSVSVRERLINYHADLRTVYSSKPSSHVDASHH